MSSRNSTAGTETELDASADSLITADITNPTPTFGFSRPTEGSYWKDDWEYNFDTLDSALTVRDTAINRGNYTPEVDRVFLATDTGEISIGDGTVWTPIESTGASPTFQAASVTTAPSASTDVVRQADLGTYAADPHGNEAHSETYLSSADLSGYTESAIAETITAQWTFNAGLDVTTLTADSASVANAPAASTDVIRQTELTTHAGTTDAHHTRYTDAEARAAAGPGLTATVQTMDYNASTGDLVLADASGAAMTVTLPAPSADMRVEVKKTDASANGVTIATPGTETIDGAANLTITAQYAARTIASDGSNYFFV